MAVKFGLGTLNGKIAGIEHDYVLVNDATRVAGGFNVLSSRLLPHVMHLSEIVQCIYDVRRHLVEPAMLVRLSYASRQRCVNIIPRFAGLGETKFRF